jgi:hypothetical protein
MWQTQKCAENFLLSWKSSAFSSFENHLHIVMMDKFIGLERWRENSQLMYMLLGNERHQEREHFLETEVTI